jgi:hypothetical protein
LTRLSLLGNILQKRCGDKLIPLLRKMATIRVTEEKSCLILEGKKAGKVQNGNFLPDVIKK